LDRGRVVSADAELSLGRKFGFGGYALIHGLGGHDFAALNRLYDCID
jgi:hypothetical protein